MSPNSDITSSPVKSISGVIKLNIFLTIRS
nr:MAG TPA: hypothetical protein [Caudoviricetes sp.]DAU41461.1 MAG TPA: hypothetical protein [Bacteriophage sp.]